MDERVGAALGALGAVSTPALLAAARWAPTVGRPRTDAPGPDGSGPAGVPRRRVPAVVVVVLAAVTLAVLAARIGLDPALPAYVVFGLVAVVLAAVDAAHHRLPDVLTLPMYVVGSALLGIAALLGSDSGSLLRGVAGAAIGFGSYALLYLAARSGIGAGDVKFAGVVGLHAAWVGWGALTVALVGGFVVGALVSLVMLAGGRAGLKTALPFGPAMVVGAVIGIGFGEPIAAAWLGR